MSASPSYMTNTLVSNPALSTDSPLVNTATSTPGMASILGGSNVITNPNDPFSTGTFDITGGVPIPPMIGSSDSGSPAGTAAPAGGSIDWSTILGNLFNASSGQWYSGLGTYGALAGLGAYEANQARSANTSTIAPINQVAQPLVNTGQQLLTSATSGQLTPAQQTVVNTAQTQGQTIVDAATPVGQIAQGLFSQYQSGQLKPADQAQLDAQTAAAKQQLRQALGPNVDSSMLATYDAQIDNQALMTKQQMLNSYLSTGNAEFDQWSQTTREGQAAILAGQQYAVTSIDQTFQKALESLSLGGNDLLAGIQLAVQSNTDISNALQGFYGNLAIAYAMQKAQAASGTGAGGRPGTSPTSAASQAAGALKNIPGLNNLLNFDPSVPTVAANTGVAGAQATGLTDLSTGLGDTGYFGSVPGMTNLTDTSGIGYFGATDMTGGLGSSTAGAGLGADVFGAATDTAATDVATSVATDTAASTLGDVGSSLLGFSAAGGGAAASTAAPAVAGATAYGADLASETATAADVAAGGDAAAGAGGLGALGTAALIAAPLLPFLYGESQPPYTVSAGYYDRTSAALQQGLQPGQPGWGVLENAALNPSAVPSGVWDQLAQYGITQDNIQQAYAQYAHMGAPDSVTGYASVGGGAGGALPV